MCVLVFVGARGYRGEGREKVEVGDRFGKGHFSPTSPFE